MVNLFGMEVGISSNFISWVAQGIYIMAFVVIFWLVFKFLSSHFGWDTATG